MVSGSSLNALQFGFTHTVNPYEAEAVTVAGRHDCAVPPFPPALDNQTVLGFHERQLLQERAISPSHSTESAAAGAVTPLADRHALGHFSASTPQFGVHSMSPADPAAHVGAINSTLQLPHVGQTEAHAGSERLMVIVKPDDDDAATTAAPPEVATLLENETSPAVSAAAIDGGLAPAPPAAQRDAAPPPDTEPPEPIQASGILLPPLPLQDPTPQPGQQLPTSWSTPPRPRLASVTFGHGAAAAGPMSPAPSDGSALGSSPAGSLADHITRAASLPLLVGGAVVSQGASGAIPIAIAGVSASGRARATTVHTPLVGSVGMGAGTTGALGFAAGSGSLGGGPRGGAPGFVDHHTVQHQLAMQHLQQQQFCSQSEAGASASSPGQWVGSPSRVNFSAFPGVGAGHVAVTETTDAAGGAAAADVEALQRTPARPDGGYEADTAGGGATPMSCRSQQPTPGARLHRYSSELQNHLPASLNGRVYGSPSRFHLPASERVAGAGEGEGAEGGRPGGVAPSGQELETALAGAEFDPMDRPNSSISSSCGQQRGQDMQQLRPVVQREEDQQGQLRGEGLAVAGDTEGDEEFEDAVEVHDDDEEHVRVYRSAHGSVARRSSQGGGCNQAHSQPLEQLHPQPADLLSQSHVQPRAVSPPLQTPPPPSPPVPIAQPQFTYTTAEAVALAGVDAAAAGSSGIARLSGATVGAVLPCGGSLGAYGPSGVGVFVEGEDEDEELLDEERDDREDDVIVGHNDLHLGADEEEEEEEEGSGLEEDDDDEEGEGEGSYAPIGAGGGASWGAPAPPYVSQYVPLERHTCVNCTRSFWGQACRYCGQPAHSEVVLPELLEGAVRSMLEGDAATRQQDQQHAQDAPHHEDARAEAVLLAYDDRCRAHLEEKLPGCAEGMGRSHPERPERVAAIMARLHASGVLERLTRITGREASLQELVAVHDGALVSELEAFTQAAARQAQQLQAGRRPGEGNLQDGDCDMAGEDWSAPRRSPHIMDCYFNASTAACARLAAGSAAEVARRVVTGAARHGAAIIRPPGHHAESSVAMGFCYYNNAAVAARAAQAAGARRVLIMDWDVHHGNGTQQIFFEDPSVLYMSTHRFDNGQFYPGTGDAVEIGAGKGMGFTVNVPWNTAGVRDADMLAAFRHVIVPVATEFRPDLVIVSAGFDAVEGDPLGGCRVSPAAFSHFTAQLSALAPTVVLLEGGYNLTATATATEACLRVLLGDGTTPLPADVPNAALEAVPSDGTAVMDAWIASGLEGVSDAALDSLHMSLRVQSRYWLAARQQLTLVEAAVQQRRQQQLLLRMQRPPLQPREQWGWHVQMPQAPAPAPLAPQPQHHHHHHQHPLVDGVVPQPGDRTVEEDEEAEVMVDVRQGHIYAAGGLRSGDACGVVQVHMVDPDMGDMGLEEEEDGEGVGVYRRRMEVSMSGVMDMGE